MGTPIICQIFRGQMNIGSSLKSLFQLHRIYNLFHHNIALVYGTFFVLTTCL